MAFSDTQANAIIEYGELPAQILLAGTVKAGDALGWSSGWVRALATVSSVVQIRCVAGEDGVSGQTITAYFGAVVIGGSRFAGATANGVLYVAEGTDNGQYTQTIPSTSDDADTVVGYMLGTIRAYVTPMHTVDSTV